MSALSEGWLAIREDLQFAVKSLARVPTYTATVVSQQLVDTSLGSRRFTLLLLSLFALGIHKRLF